MATRSTQLPSTYCSVHRLLYEEAQVLSSFPSQCTSLTCGHPHFLQEDTRRHLTVQWTWAKCISEEGTRWVGIPHSAWGHYSWGSWPLRQSHSTSQGKQRILGRVMSLAESGALLHINVGLSDPKYGTQPPKNSCQNVLSVLLGSLHIQAKLACSNDDEGTTGTPRTGGWVFPRVGPDAVAKRKRHLPLQGIELRKPVRSLVTKPTELQ